LLPTGHFNGNGSIIVFLQESIKGSAKANLFAVKELCKASGKALLASAAMARSKILLLLLLAALLVFCQSLPDKNTALPMHRIPSGGPAAKNLLFAAVHLPAPLCIAAAPLLFLDLQKANVRFQGQGFSFASLMKLPPSTGCEGELLPFARFSGSAPR
jgi:hypothetical protein